eukprot:CAMPEP_0197245186 /NCGR_PEP_ID=MMETSP1429-20130617/10053_1 /TAXON_ID=49237 /ORGANISM="Chaetoceros  sp., Strain UNC1202" /LENGTH=273 /DNA_ID=CAMNT_0042705637 /DNA_START=74 /DNA_END=895 /DNA_ORIENTATION=+
MAEKLCRLHKHCLRNCGAAAYKPMLEKLCTHLVRNFAHSRQSPYLYAASVCISEYNKDSTCLQSLYKMMEEMGKSSFELLRSMDNFKNHPDVVEELFFLAGKMVHCCPEPFVTSAMFHSFIQCATVGMKQDHRDANRGTLSFLDKVFSFGLLLQGSNINDPIRASCKQSLEQVISKEGQTIVSNLMLSLMGELPCYRISNPSGSIAALLYKLHQICPGMLVKWMNTTLISKVPESQRAMLVDSLGQQQSREDFFLACERFESICAKSQKMGGM